MTGISLFETLDGLGFSGIQYFLSVLWQSSILFGAVWILSYFLRRRQAAVRHLLWAGALLVAPFLPLLAEAVSQAGSPQVRVPVMPAYPAPRAERVVPEGPALPAQDASASEELPAVPEETFSPADYPWALGLMGYGAGLAVMLSLVALGRVRLWLWRRRSRAAGDPRLRGAFGSARRELGIGRRVSLRESDEVDAPLTVGLFRPAVLVPSGLADALSDEDLRAVAFHELTHVRRLDAPVLGLISVVRAVLWFHPLVWLACRQVSGLAETACDDAVLEADVEPVKYAGMLTRIAEGLPRRAVSLEIGANMIFSKSKFFRRIETILSDRRGRIKKLTKLALAGTVVAAVLSVGLAVMLPVGGSEKPDRLPHEVVQEQLEKDTLVRDERTGATYTVGSIDDRANVSDTSGNGTRSRQSVRSPRNIAGDMRESIVAVWSRMAAKHEIGPPVRKHVRELMEDVLRDARIEPDKDSIDRFEKSLDKFIKMEKSALTEPKSTRGVGYWLALCTAQAFSRHPSTGVDTEAIVGSYDPLLEEVGAVMNDRLLAELPSDKQSRWDERIAEGVKDFKRVVHERIEELSGDFLCPAFKRPMISAARQEVLHQFKNSLRYPKYQDPLRMMQTKDELYAAKLRDWFNNSVHGCLFLLFFEDVKEMLRCNKYWGRMHYAASSRYARWPAMVRITPWPTMNKARGWERE